LGRSRDLGCVAHLQLPLDSPPSCEYLTIAEAAERVRCCERTIRRAIDSGALRAGRVRGERDSRGDYVIRLADLDAWLYATGSPSVDARRHRRVDGSVSESWSVRYYDTGGRRRWLACRSQEYAECSGRAWH
jgi:excisionase family DNA binding protein